MLPRTTHLVLPSAALSLLAGCLIEVTPEPPPPPPPPPPPGVVLDLQGQLLDAEGRPAPFVPVQLGIKGGPVVATDETGTFVFPAVEAGQHRVYAFDRFAQHVAVATFELVPESELDLIMKLKDCNDALDDDSSDIEVINVCFSDVGIDLPPSALDITVNQLELSAGAGYTNPYNTSASMTADADEAREVFFSMQDGLGRGGVREFTIVDHRLEGAEPGSDPFREPSFHITTRDRHGHQRYTVRDGVFRLEVAEGNTATRSYVLTGTNLVLDYGEPFGPFDPRYTLTVNSLRLEGTMEIELPPPPPAGDVNLVVPSPYFFASYPAGRESLLVTIVGDRTSAQLTLDPTQLPLPGSITVELPVGEVPNLEGDTLITPSDSSSLAPWDFQLVSYTLTTNMTELPGCNDQLKITLENLVFRFVGWDYDENSDRVDSFGEQTLTIDRIDVSALVVDETPGACR